jgi:hypothetical protein
MTTAITTRNTANAHEPDERPRHDIVI